MLNLFLYLDLQTPKLTLRKPNSLAVSPGEGLEFRCEIPGSECKSVNFFLNTASIKSTEKCNEQLSVTASDQGQYTCSYTGVNFTSSKSNTITITVGKCTEELIQIYISENFCV